MSHPLFLPMFGHLLMLIALYTLLTMCRAGRVWGLSKLSPEQLEPAVSANLSNQFEWPLFFYVGCWLMPLETEWLAWYQGLAWVFILGRLWHSWVQIASGNIKLRGIVFTLNFLAVVAMWILLAMEG